jgi:hypothetical protein
LPACESTVPSFSKGAAYVDDSAAFGPFEDALIDELLRCGAGDGIFGAGGHVDGAFVDEFGTAAHVELAFFQVEGAFVDKSAFFKAGVVFGDVRNRCPR